MAGAKGAEKATVASRNVPLERVADKYNISILVLDLPRVRALAANKTVDSIPGLGAPTHGIAPVTMFGRFGDLAYYVRQPDEKAIKAVEKYLRDRELCGVAVLFVPSERYVPRLMTAPIRTGPPVDLSLVALAAGAAAVATALLLRRRV